MKRLSVFLAVLFIFTSGEFLHAKRSASKKKSNILMRIDQPISVKFPEMKVYVSVVNKRDKEPILSLIRGNFSVMVDGRDVKGKLDVAGFQYTEEGISYSLLISANGLMEGEPIESQKQAAVDLSEFLREQDELSVYIYADEVKPVFEFQKRNESLVQKINKIDVMGSSPHLYDVLVHAARRLSESKISRKVVIIMSDGRDVGSRFRREQLFEVLDEKNIPVYGVGVKLMAGQNLYKIAEISKHSGGGYIYAGALDDIPQCMRVIHNQVSLGYVLNFEVDNIEADNKLHQLQVKVRDKGAEDVFFKNFIAVKVPVSFWVMVVLGIIALVIIIIIIILFIIRLRRVRKRLGITKRKCPECSRIMKDEWDDCPFCKYIPPRKRFEFIKKFFKLK